MSCILYIGDRGRPHHFFVCGVHLCVLKGGSENKNGLGVCSEEESRENISLEVVVSWENISFDDQPPRQEPSLHAV